MKFQETKIVFDKIFLPKLKAKDAEIKNVLSQLNHERKTHVETHQKLKKSEAEGQNHEVLRRQMEAKNAVLKAQVKELNSLLQSSLKNAAGHRDLVADAEISRLNETIKKFSNFFLCKLKK